MCFSLEKKISRGDLSTVAQTLNAFGHTSSKKVYLYLLLIVCLHARAQAHAHARTHARAREREREKKIVAKKSKRCERV